MLTTGFYFVGSSVILDSLILGCNHMEQYPMKWKESISRLKFYFLNLTVYRNAMSFQILNDVALDKPLDL